MSNKELPLLMPEREHLFWQLTYHLKEKRKEYVVVPKCKKYR